MPSDAATQACAVGQFWTDRVREMMDAGLIKRGDPHQVSMTLWAHGHGLISIYHRGLLPVRSEGEFRSLVIESYLRVISGIGTEAYQALLGGETQDGAGEEEGSREWISRTVGTAGG
jgi:hypothetical protein